MLEVTNEKGDVTQEALDTTRDTSRVVAVVDGFAEAAIAKVQAVVAADTTHPHFETTGVDVIAVTLVQEAE